MIYVGLIVVFALGFVFGMAFQWAADLHQEYRR